MIGGNAGNTKLNEARGRFEPGHPASTRCASPGNEFDACKMFCLSLAALSGKWGLRRVRPYLSHHFGMIRAYSMISASVANPPNLIVARLKLEAALRYLELAVRVQDGRLLIEASFGAIPVLINSTPQNGIQVAMLMHLGVCLGPDADFFNFIAQANEQSGGVTVEVNKNGAVGLRWVDTFARDIDCSRVTDGLAALGVAYNEIGEELRQRLFVQPVADDSQKNEGVE